jgi:hypothetical protein
MLGGKRSSTNWRYAEGLIYEVTIKELRSGKDVMAEIDAEIRTEFGIRLSRKLPEGSSLFAFA